jgi:uncharacterized protein YxeA
MKKILLIGAFCVVIVAIIAGGLLYYNYERDESAKSMGYLNYDDYKRVAKAGFASSKEEKEALNFGVDTKAKYVAAKAGGFKTGEEYFTAYTNGFHDAASFRQAQELGYSTRNDFDKGQAGGFKTGEEYFTAYTNGFHDAASFRQAQELGYSTRNDFDKGQAGGFANAAEWGEANRGGFDNATLYHAALRRGAQTLDQYKSMTDGNNMIARGADGTSYNRSQCLENDLGKMFYFSGKIIDVLSPYRVKVSIFTAESNFANVMFMEPVAGNMRKDQTIHFLGRLTDLGTGVIISHDISDAELYSP